MLKKRPVQIFMYGAAGVMAMFLVGLVLTGVFYATFTPNCTGVAATDTAAFNSLLAVIGSRTGTLKVPWTTTRCVVNDLTIPANVTLDFASNSTGIQVANSKVLTINGPISAPAGQQIFYNALSGQGSVVINNGQPIRPDWWTANTTPDTTDMLAALKAAVAAVPTRGGTVAMLDTAYKASGLLTVSRSDITLQCGPGTNLHFTGSGGLYVNGTGIVNGARNVQIQGCTVSGNASLATAVHLRDVANGAFRIRPRNVTDYAILVEHGVGLKFDWPNISSNDGTGFTTTPKYGFYLDSNPGDSSGTTLPASCSNTTLSYNLTMVDGAHDPGIYECDGAHYYPMGSTNTSDTSIDHPIIEGITTAPGVAIYADHADKTNVNGGTLEACTIGYKGTSHSSLANLNGPWCEANSSADIEDGGFFGHYTNVNASKLLHFTSTAYSAQVVGGSYKDITIDSGATSITLDKPAYATAGSLTDNGTGTTGQVYSVATGWKTFVIAASDGTGSKSILALNHPGGFASNAEGQLDFTTGSTGLVVGRIATHFVSGSIWDMYVYSYNGGLVNTAIYGGNGDVTLGGSIKVNGYVSTTAPITKTNDFTWAVTENWITCNKGSTLTTVLPAAASFPGRPLHVKTIQAQTVVSASSNVVPLVGGSAGTAILAGTAGKWATLVSDGTNWIVTEGN